MWSRRDAEGQGKMGFSGKVGVYQARKEHSRLKVSATLGGGGGVMVGAVSYGGGEPVD